MNAREQKRTTILRRSSDSLILSPVEVFAFSRHRSAISCNSISVLFVRGELSIAGARGVNFATETTSAAIGDHEAAETIKIPGGSETQKCRANAVFLDANSFRVAEFSHFINAMVNKAKIVRRENAKPSAD